MTLKKSDKIIAVIGVVILIVAIFGILLYAGSEEQTQETVTPKKVSYQVNWIPSSDTLSKDGYAGRKGDYTEPFTIEVIKPGSIITSVDVKITWADTKTEGILRKVGFDTLNAEITNVGGETLTHISTGSGNETLTFKINEAPSDQIIEDVEDIFAAEQKVIDENADKNTASFETLIKVTPGEKLGIRPIKILRYILDKGENFNLEITYNYVYPEIIEVGDNNPNTGDNITAGNHEIYTSTNYAFSKL
jgi:hypothetical protein